MRPLEPRPSAAVAMDGSVNCGSSVRWIVAGGQVHGRFSDQGLAQQSVWAFRLVSRKKPCFSGRWFRAEYAELAESGNAISRPRPRGFASLCASHGSAISAWEKHNPCFSGSRSRTVCVSSPPCIPPKHLSRWPRNLRYTKGRPRRQDVGCNPLRG